MQPRCLVPSRSQPLRWSSRLSQARHACGVQCPTDDARAAADRFDAHVGMPGSKMALHCCSAICSCSCSFPCPCLVCVPCVCVVGSLCLEPRTQVIAPYVVDADWAEAVSAEIPGRDIPRSYNKNADPTCELCAAPLRDQTYSDESLNTLIWTY